MGITDIKIRKMNQEHCGKCSDFPCGKLLEYAKSQNPKIPRELII